MRIRMKRKDVDLTNLLLLAEVAANIDKYENNINYSLYTNNRRSSNKEKENCDRDECQIMKKEENRDRNEGQIMKKEENSDGNEGQIMKKEENSDRDGSHIKKDKENRDESQMMKRNPEDVGYHMPYKKLRSSHCHHGWIEAHARLRATPPIWIYDKLLTESDTRNNQNRLLLGAAAIEDALLPHLNEDQRRQLWGLKENRKENDGLQVITLDEMGRHWNNMKLKQWISGSYALKGDWTKIVETNRLVARHDAVRVYAFKYGKENKYVGFVVTRTP